MSVGLKLAGVAIAVFLAGVVAFLLFTNIWARIGLGAAVIVMCGGLILWARRVDRRDRELREGLERI
jgi:membrane protein implicated in regulation of membrane protease activity